MRTAVDCCLACTYASAPHRSDWGAKVRANFDRKAVHKKFVEHTGGSFQSGRCWLFSPTVSPSSSRPMHMACGGVGLGSCHKQQIEMPKSATGPMSLPC